MYSIQHTSVANTLVLIAAFQFFAAIFSIFLLNEKPNLFTWMTIFFALVGVIIIGWGSFTSTGIFGDIMALIMASAMGLSMVIVRYYKEKDLIPACLIGCIIATLYALPFDINFNFKFLSNISFNDDVFNNFTNTFHDINCISKICSSS